MTETSLENLGLDCVDVQQLHVWTDAWADDERWQRAVDDLKREGLIRAFGISVNRWEPANVVKALRTGVVDCVQVVYNIFDQNPEDELFPRLPGAERRHHRAGAVRRREPDRRAGAPTPTFPEGDWRDLYFTGDNLRATRRPGRRG